MEELETKLDSLDRKLLAELDDNSRIPVTALAKRLRISREVAKYRLKRLIDTGIIKSFTTMVNPAKFGLLIYKVYLKVQNLCSEKEKELIDFLKKEKEVFWLAKTDGSFDFIAALYSRNTVEFDRFLMSFIDLFGSHIVERRISNTVYSDVFKKKYLLEKSNGPEKTIWGGIPEKEEMDRASINILKEMAENARIPISEICEKLNTTAKTALSKIRLMEKKNIILGYRAILNIEKLRLENFKAIIYFQNAPQKRIRQFSQFCLLNPYIMYLIKTAGEWDVELDIEIGGYKKYNGLIDEIKLHFGDIIKSIGTVYIAQELKGELNVVANL